MSKEAGVECNAVLQKMLYIDGIPTRSMMMC